MTAVAMRPPRSSARWLLVSVLAVPGCFFGPIFHPPSDHNGDASSSDVGGRDAASSIDAGLVPNDDCAGFADPATGRYAPDAHHQDGAVCSLPTASDASATDVSSAPDASIDVFVPNDATDATDEATDAATDGNEAAPDATDESVDATDESSDGDPDAGD